PLTLIFPLNDPMVPVTYTLSLHDALPIWTQLQLRRQPASQGLNITIGDGYGLALDADQVHHRWQLQHWQPMLALELNKQITRERSEEHTSELQSRFDLVCRLLLEKKKNNA